MIVKYRYLSIELCRYLGINYLSRRGMCRGFEVKIFLGYFRSRMKACVVRMELVRWVVVGNEIRERVGVRLCRFYCLRKGFGILF